MLKLNKMIVIIFAAITIGSVQADVFDDFLGATNSVPNITLIDNSTNYTAGSIGTLGHTTVRDGVDGSGGNPYITTQSGIPGATITYNGSFFTLTQGNYSGTSGAHTVKQAIIELGGNLVTGTAIEFTNTGIWYDSTGNGGVTPARPQGDTRLATYNELGQVVAVVGDTYNTINNINNTVTNIVNGTTNIGDYATNDDLDAETDRSEAADIALGTRIDNIQLTPGADGDAGTNGADGADGADGDDFDGDARLTSVEGDIITLGEVDKVLQIAIDLVQDNLNSEVAILEAADSTINTRIDDVNTRLTTTVEQAQVELKLAIENEQIALESQRVELQGNIDNAVADIASNRGVLQVHAAAISANTNAIAALDARVSKLESMMQPKPTPIEHITKVFTQSNGDRILVNFNLDGTVIDVPRKLNFFEFSTPIYSADAVVWHWNGTESVLIKRSSL